MVERRGAQGAVGEGGELVVRAAPDDVQVNHMCGLGYRPGAAALGKRGLARRRSSGQAAAHLSTGLRRWTLLRRSKPSSPRKRRRAAAGQTAMHW